MLLLHSSIGDYDLYFITVYEFLYISLLHTLSFELLITDFEY